MKTTFLTITLIAISLLVYYWISKDTLSVKLEDAMLKTNNALIENDFNKFKKSLNSKSRHKRLSKRNWVKIQNSNTFKNMFITNIYPNLSKETKLITCKRKGNFAVYYAECHLYDKEYLTIGTFCFYFENNEWKAIGKGYGLCKARPGSNREKEGYVSWSGEDDILNTINTNKRFSLESLQTDKDFIYIEQKN